MNRSRLVLEADRVAVAQRERVHHERSAEHQVDDRVPQLQRVARRCGYATVETMHRSFRRVVGVTPGEYRDRFKSPLRDPAV